MLQAWHLPRSFSSCTMGIGEKVWIQYFRSFFTECSMVLVIQFACALQSYNWRCTFVSLLFSQFIRYSHNFKAGIMWYLSITMNLHIRCTPVSLMFPCKWGTVPQCISCLFFVCALYLQFGVQIWSSKTWFILELICEIYVFRCNLYGIESWCK